MKCPCAGAGVRDVLTRQVPSLRRSLQSCHHIGGSGSDVSVTDYSGLRASQAQSVPQLKQA